MIQRVVVATVHDPCLYASENLENEDRRGLLIQFLQSAVNNQVLVFDNENLIRDMISEQRPELGRWPDVQLRLEEFFKKNRNHSFSDSDNTNRIADLIKPWLDLTNRQQRGHLAVLSLAGESHVDGVVVAKETEDIANCTKLPALEHGKILKLSKAGELNSNTSQSLFEKSRKETEVQWFEPILKWGETVTLVDKQVGTAFESRGRPGSNWYNFNLTINWLYRCWSKQSIVKRRWFEVLTHPARDESGRMGEPNTDMAAGLWRDLGQHGDMRVTIIKESKTSQKNRAGGDITHERYLNSMPMDFTLSVGRGFDFLKEEEGDAITQACTVSLLSERPKDLSIILELRNSGVTYPEKRQRAVRQDKPRHLVL